tara:strand:- start:361 stop:1383 length:1023 start_codon:yes stop_codon:yes gene_type:complete
MKKLNVLVAGATGYIGIQLVKLLVKHKYVNIKYLCGSTSAGKKISYFDKDLKKKKLPKIIKFNHSLLKDVSVVFTALPNGEAQTVSNQLNDENILIDLAADFRLNKASEYLKWYKLKHKAKKNISKSIYALPEIVGNKIKNYKIISCPGCYPTSILIPLIPLIKNRLIKTKNIIIDSKSGYSGAGKGVHKKYKNHNLYESLKAYGIFKHRHNSEVKNELRKHTNKNVDFVFTPHLSPMFRGILTTIYLDLNRNINVNKIQNYLKKFYKKSQFVKIEKLNTLLSTNDVINTNLCKIALHKSKKSNKLIVLSAIDNLIKGGSGQAIQNMNIKYNFPKGHGLT